MTATPGAIKGPRIAEAVDWFRLLWDLIQRGWSLQRIADTTNISRTTLRGYLQGSQPPHYRGEALIDLWRRELAKDRTDLAVAEVVRHARSAGIRDAVHASSEAAQALQQLTFGWAAGRAPETQPEPEPETIRFRVGVGRIDGAMRAFIVYTNEDELRAESAPAFLRWSAEWIEETS